MTWGPPVSHRGESNERGVRSCAVASTPSFSSWNVDVGRVREGMSPSGRRERKWERIAVSSCVT
ncbi:hypothetical protein E2562_017943 [Oryza meyeriana var. granulata]|uniref:Uncharacterized protein n=1 Tax=Oryza meyeriana var. granulata TaxID=110450 RepID=A0A6G1F8S4_9ORYZ|nr:hypothetical protein E2562_017943 [Oryza meyeriana var. granulata]